MRFRRRKFTLEKQTNEDFSLVHPVSFPPMNSFFIEHERARTTCKATITSLSFSLTVIYSFAFNSIELKYSHSLFSDTINKLILVKAHFNKWTVPFLDTELMNNLSASPFFFFCIPLLSEKFRSDFLLSFSNFNQAGFRMEPMDLFLSIVVVVLILLWAMKNEKKKKKKNL